MSLVIKSNEIKVDPVPPEVEAEEKRSPKRKSTFDLFKALGGSKDDLYKDEKGKEKEKSEKESDEKNPTDSKPGVGHTRTIRRASSIGASSRPKLPVLTSSQAASPAPRKQSKSIDDEAVESALPRIPLPLPKLPAKSDNESSTSLPSPSSSAAALSPVRHPPKKLPQIPTQGQKRATKDSTDGGESPSGSADPS